jgi:hypothetical protein
VLPNGGWSADQAEGGRRNRVGLADCHGMQIMDLHGPDPDRIPATRALVTKTQFVEYRDRGLWAYDVALGVFLKHLIDVAEAHKPGELAWLSDAVTSWRVVACVSDYGFTIDPAWSAHQVETFASLAEAACDRLAERESISADEIALQGGCTYA